MTQCAARAAAGRPGLAGVRRRRAAGRRDRGRPGDAHRRPGHRRPRAATRRRCWRRSGLGPDDLAGPAPPRRRLRPGLPVPAVSPDAVARAQVPVGATSATSVSSPGTRPTQVAHVRVFAPRHGRARGPGHRLGRARASACAWSRPALLQRRRRVVLCGASGRAGAPAVGHRGHGVRSGRRGHPGDRSPDRSVADRQGRDRRPTLHRDDWTFPRSADDEGRATSRSDVELPLRARGAGGTACGCALVAGAGRAAVAASEPSGRSSERHRSGSVG